MSLTELLGFVTGAICVWMCVKENVWLWPTGIANNIFYIVVFWRSGLYGDSLLQFVYIAVSVYGWWNWLRGGVGHSRLEITRASTAEMVLYTFLAALGTGILYNLLRQHTNSTVPVWDGVTTALSLMAQYMLTRKIVENWWFWIIADVIYVVLYIYKGLFLTSALYAIFLGMCIVGLRQWQHTLAARETTLAREATA